MFSSWDFKILQLFFCVGINEYYVSDQKENTWWKVQLSEMEIMVANHESLMIMTRYLVRIVDGNRKATQAPIKSNAKVPDVYSEGHFSII